MNMVSFEARDGVARLTLNRPDKLNAICGEVLDGLRAALDTVQSNEDIRVLVLTGTGRGFCAGQDLTEQALVGQGGTPRIARSLDERYHPVIRGLYEARVPTICAVNGIAAGAGANLALSCDIVLAARSAQFIEAFCRIGLIPDCGGTWHLPRLIGRQRALGLMLTGDPISGEEAAAMGLIWKAVDDEALESETAVLAARMAAGPTKALELTKKAVRASWANDFAAQLDVERDLQQEAGETEDFREGVAAFAQKRLAVFTGR